MELLHRIASNLAQSVSLTGKNWHFGEIWATLRCLVLGVARRDMESNLSGGHLISLPILAVIP